MNTQRRGFTLIELLIVIVIVGILAAIGQSRLWNAKDRALISTMQSDLRTMAIHQESYFGRHYNYATVVTDLPDFQPSPGVELSITYAQTDGWAVIATHPSSPGTQCGYFQGDAPAGSADPADEGGVVRCT